MKDGNGWLALAYTGVFAIIIILFLLPLGAFGHDHSRPDLDEWYRSLQSVKGPCCGGPDEDATQLNDLQWRTKGESYEVFLDGEWIDVPPEAVVREPNKAGRALIWLYYFDGKPAVRCFMPGIMG